MLSVELLSRYLIYTYIYPGINDNSMMSYMELLDWNNVLCKQLPANAKLWSRNTKIVNAASRRNKGKGKCIEGENHNQREDILQESRLPTLDIFAGCGGLSEGLQQAGKLFIYLFFIFIIL